MRTRSQARNRNRRQQQQTPPVVVEPFDLEEPFVNHEITMADNRTMAQMLQAPIEGYEDAIVVPPINANNFELKQPLINLVQSNKFTGRQDPHNHLRFFNKVTSTFRHPEVPNTSIKLLLFPFSLDGEARDWLDKEPPRSILTWDDLVLKFINQFFPPSKTTYLRNEITTFYQKPNETFNEAWERFKGLLRQCPHAGGEGWGAIWKNLGYSEWSTPAGLKLARENLQSRVKEEDSITDVENAIFDLGVMDSLWPSKLCARAQPVDDMPSRTLTYMECTRWVFCKLYGRPRERHPVYPTKRHGFRPRSFQEFFSNHDWIPQLVHLFVDCNTPKIGSQRNVFPGALLHDPIAQVRRERPLT
ncbi:reverse transcriptase domain-containing protein [Tanacetum coccineum]|uniref:Reverse transcriptase domain-containing protein n=1 Tax=Tanacetum coccineum TaxID=301880 RepID=A0ABQ5IFF5_9ASTR